MYFDESRRPIDTPAPPTPDEAAAAFGMPLIGLAPQPALDEASIGSGSQTHNDRVVMRVATVTYTVWRNPDDRDDPANLLDLPEPLRSELDTLPPWPLPEWMLASRERMRYPWLWDAVRTTRVIDDSVVTWVSAETELVDHVNYVLMNVFREERTRGDAPPEVLGAATVRAIEHGIPISLDGVEVSGMRIDTDAHVYGVAIDLGDRIVTAVVPRDMMPYFTMTFASRRTAS